MVYFPFPHIFLGISTIFSVSCGQVGLMSERFSAGCSGSQVSSLAATSVQWQYLTCASPRKTGQGKALQQKRRAQEWKKDGKASWSLFGITEHFPQMGYLLFQILSTQGLEGIKGRNNSKTHQKYCGVVL